MPALSAIGSATFGRVQDAVARFEDAWHDGGRPQIEDHLPAAPGSRYLALVELVHAELELRLKAGEPARVEEYLERFAELVGDDELVLDLLAAEFTVRRREENDLSPEEYARRFPRLAAGLGARLSTLPGWSPVPNTLLVTADGGAARRADGETGRYRVLRPHARGGLGQVSVAVDDELRRQVALKEIRPEYAHDAVARARFLLEAEVTGQLEHPGVVPVYGLGSYADGRPFYAMRFVQGDSLHDAIRHYHRGGDPAAQPLAFRRLLGRFVDVCNAVAYAHSKGVLHRDLKPANVLLGPYGETLVVDWGLAKRVDSGQWAVGSNEEEVRGQQSEVSEAAPSSLPTAHCPLPTVEGQVLGTPGYMAPEQATGEVDRLGAATDVYGLGATLYHLLSGRPPIEGADPVEVLARVRKGDFARPRQVQGNVPAALEAVCLKAMALRPEERYGSPKALAEELERWLADEPVAAYPEPIAVRVRRQTRRHPTALAATAALLLTGLVGLGVGLAAVGAEQQRTAGERDRAEANAAEAHRQRSRSEAVNKFLLDDLLAQAAPENNARQKKVTVEDVLARAAAKIGTGFAGQPEVEADVRRAVGVTYYKLGLYEAAQPHLERALALRRQHQGPDHVDTLEAVSDMALLLQDQGKWAEAEPLFRQNLEDRHRVLGPDHYDTLSATNNLAAMLQEQGKLTEAEPLYRQALEGCRRVLGAEHVVTLTTLNNLAAILENQGKLAEAEPLARQAREASRRVQGADHPLAMSAQVTLGNVLYTQGKFAEAEPLFRESLAANRRVFGAEHPMTLTTVNNLARVLQEQAKFSEAEPLLHQCLEGRRRVLGPDHPDTLMAVNNLASFLTTHGKPVEAELLLRQNLESRRRVAGPDHPDTLIAANNLAGVLHRQGKAGEAEPLYRQNLEVYRRVLGAEHPNVLVATNNLGYLLQDQRKYAEAERLARETLASGRKVLPTGHMTIADSLTLLGAVLTATDRAGEAEPVLREALASRRKGLPRGHPLTARTESQLGTCLAAEQKFAEAEPLLLSSYQTSAQAPGMTDAERRRARQRLVKFYEAWGKPREAAKWKAGSDRDDKPAGSKTP